MKIFNYEREQTREEEIANTISHGFGLVLAIVATPFILTQAAQQKDMYYLVGVCIFAVSMIVLYLSSTLYHAIHPGSLKRIFQTIEHSAIYLLIAGTYTPFTLGVLSGNWGWAILGLIWVLAIIGISLKVFGSLPHPIISAVIYLLMGWLIVIAIDPLLSSLPTFGIGWIVAGGLFYTLGIPFFALDSHLRYGHFIWHLFVIAGTTCHYFAIYWYAAPV